MEQPRCSRSALRGAGAGRLRAADRAGARTRISLDGIPGAGRSTALRLKEVRLCLRLAMLFHDTGKLLGERPRRHGAISARLFSRARPAWFPDRLVPLTRWLIRTHDVFGAFGRGLSEQGYYGALDSQAVRRALLEGGLPLDEAAAINKAIWQADVGAIAALRWLLPVAELVERLVLVPLGPRRPDRRRPTC